MLSTAVSCILPVVGGLCGVAFRREGSARRRLNLAHRRIYLEEIEFEEGY